ncbi:MAG: hypothetical protein HRJ53_14245 [Acidobacteria bacterium Pan2503]|uniref:Uncharacterized protein n=1 Tax=Candidatus Acidiferrum panamense TaxID=2741543 RepID=A0A7V8SXM4_9BACT|nr:hypothetical protein [Candidatus Acidoferrum panamensis]
MIMTDEEKLCIARDEFLRVCKDYLLPIAMPIEGDGPTMIAGVWYESKEQALKAYE